MARPRSARGRGPLGWHRPAPTLYPEAPYEWITHEAVITKDEVAIAIIAHQKVGTKNDWGIAGTQEHPTGLGIVNLRTREMRIAGQLPFGDPGRSVWHVERLLGWPLGRRGRFSSTGSAAD